MAKPAQSLAIPRGQGIAGDRCKLTRVRVEQDHAVRREIAESVHHRSCLHLATELVQPCTEGVRDSLRTSSGNRPAAGVSRRRQRQTKS